MIIFGISLGICIALSGIYFLLFPNPKAKNSLKRRLLADVIDLVNKAKSRRRKIQILKSNMCRALSSLIQINYDKNIILDVDLKIFYNERLPNDASETINHSAKIWNSFLNTSPHTRQRKNLRLKGMLESLDRKESKLFLKAANRQLNLGVNYFTLKRCFPKTFIGKL